jgi:hypothetical protein
MFGASVPEQNAGAIDMNNFHGLITPERAIRAGDSRSLAVLRQVAREPETICWGCALQMAWRYLGIGLCFTCATGEVDGSNDFEIVPRPLVSGFGKVTCVSRAPTAGSDGWMQERGFTWETPVDQNPQWRQARTGFRVRRLPEWSNEEWTRRKIDIAERAERAGQASRQPRQGRRPAAYRGSSRQAIAWAT